MPFTKRNEVNRPLFYSEIDDNFQTVEDLHDNILLIEQSVIASGELYPDTATGLANTVNGDYFNVVAADSGDYTELYLNDSGAAVLQKTLTLYDDSSKINYSPDGIGATDRTVESKLRDIVSVSDFGAVGDNIADDTLAIQAAFDAAMDGYSLDFIPGKTYKISNTIVCDKFINVNAKGAKFNVVADVIPFDFTRPAIEIKELTADYTPGDLSITVDTLSTALEKGQPFKIFSNAVDPANRDQGSSANQYRIGEWSHATGGTTTSITLENPLRFSRAVNPTSTGGEEPRVDSYLQTYNARIAVIDNTGSMSWVGGTIFFEEGHEADPWTKPAMNVVGHFKPNISGLSVTRGYGNGVKIAGCYRPIVKDGSFRNLENNTALGQFGYGVADSSYMSVIHGCSFEDCRHGYTTNATTNPINYSTTGRIFSTGRVVGSIISDCTGYSSENAVFDTHHGAEDITFINCVAEGGQAEGFAIRGRNVRTINPVVLNCNEGIKYFTEFESGDPDDDFYTSGKPEGLTTGEIINPLIKVKATPIDFSNVRRGLLVGGQIECTSHKMIRSAGSDVTIDGNINFKVTDFDGAESITEETDVGIFDVDDINATLSPYADYEAIISFSAGASINVDATSATDALSDMHVFDAEANSTIENKGKLNIQLSTDFSSLCESVGNYTATPGSSIIWSIDGAADNNFTGVGSGMNLLTTGFKANAEDGSAWYDNTGVFGQSEKFVYQERPEVAHAGTGAKVDNVYIPDYSPVSMINEDGHFVKYEFFIQKTGSNGTAILTIDIGGSFNENFTMNASDSLLRISHETFTEAANMQRTYMDAKSSAGSSMTTDKLAFKNETANLSALTDSIISFDVEAAVGDTITFKSVKCYSDVSGYGVD